MFDIGKTYKPEETEEVCLTFDDEHNALAIATILVEEGKSIELVPGVDVYYLYFEAVVMGQKKIE